MFLSRTKADVVLVDASCPDGSGNWARTLNNRRLTVLYKAVPHWNLAAVRNAGAKLAIKNGATHLIFLDADTIVQERFWSVIESKLDQDLFLIMLPSCIPDLMGFIAVPTERFVQVGGYDPQFKEYGHEDLDLRLRLYLKTGRFGNLEDGLLSAISHDDTLRVQFIGNGLSRWEQLEKTVQLLHNKYYSIAGVSLSERSKGSSVYYNLLGGRVF